MHLIGWPSEPHVENKCAMSRIVWPLSPRLTGLVFWGFRKSETNNRATDLAVFRVCYYDRTRAWLTLLWSAIIRVWTAVTHSKGMTRWSYYTTSELPLTETWGFPRHGQYGVQSLFGEVNCHSMGNVNPPPGFRIDHLSRMADAWSKRAVRELALFYWKILSTSYPPSLYFTSAPWASCAFPHPVCLAFLPHDFDIGALVA